MATHHSRTARTIHRMTEGRVFRLYGQRFVNGTGASGRADCGAMVGSGAEVTSDPVTCPKCASGNLSKEETK